jgi:plastocyanin
VTFGKEPGNPYAVIGDPTKYDGTGPLSSGAVVPGKPYEVTFKKAGTYNYICAFDDDMGMVGRVIVVN